MQIRKDQLQRQQMIMSALGYYRHKCDGIWGPASIEAKAKWEMEKSFIPGLPNNGLPLGPDDLLPSGISYDPASRMFKHAELTEDKIKSYTNKPDSPKSAEPKKENVIPAPPKQEETEEAKQEEKVAETVAENANAQPTPNNQNQQNNQPQNNQNPNQNQNKHHNKRRR